MNWYIYFRIHGKCHLWTERFLARNATGNGKNYDLLIGGSIKHINDIKDILIIQLSDNNSKNSANGIKCIQFQKNFSHHSFVCWKFFTNKSEKIFCFFFILFLVILNNHQPNTWKTLQKNLFPLMASHVQISRFTIKKESNKSKKKTNIFEISMKIHF